MRTRNLAAVYPYITVKYIRFYFISFFCILLFSLTFVLDSIAQQVKPLPPADSVPLLPAADTLISKFFGRAAGTLLLSELTPWVVDNYIRKVDYTKISWHTLGYNLSPAHWQWDGDGFTTNQFGHPYHGSYFFNSFRCNGYTFWQSAIASFTGSYLWETAAENQAPAPNDLINTGYGGIILGEMTHRLADKIVNNRQQGFRRQVAELAAFIVNPVNGFNRIINGRWGRLRLNSAERDSSEINTVIDVGMRQYAFDKQAEKFGWYGHFRFMYGTPYEKNKTPFSNILIQAEFGKDDSSKLSMVTVYGSVNGWQLQHTANHHQLLLLTANYDYIRNSAFFYSAQSVKLNWYARFGLTHKVKVNAIAGAGLLLLAAVPDIHGYKGRYYNYCTGAGISAGITVNIANHISATANYRGGWLKTINGNASHYLLHVVTTELSYLVNKKFSLCAGQGYFTLHGNYKNFADVHKVYPYLRFSMRYSFMIR